MMFLNFRVKQAGYFCEHSLVFSCLAMKTHFIKVPKAQFLHAAGIWDGALQHFETQSVSLHGL